ncbi:hypothetical protein V0I11_02970 [Pasteurella multocida]|uniref:hypothetical protein n=1 Tax=Pasteurella multocida TaxID=747 RepID=UPI00287918B3|nr:hypothetical protein V0I11_02970 [Pasteurella multocida]HDX1086915.1 hypothetical protein [Pasteurella multocida]
MSTEGANTVGKMLAIAAIIAALGFLLLVRRALGFVFYLIFRYKSQKNIFQFCIIYILLQIGE